MKFLQNKKIYLLKISPVFLILSIFSFSILFLGVAKTVKADEHPFVGGLGTIESPYGILTCEQLQAINNKDGEDFLYLEKTFELLGDIDCSLTNPFYQSELDNYYGSWTDGKGFNPIGDANIYFSGHFIGNNFKIEKLFINRPNEDNIGLFSVLFSVNINNISLVNFNITGKEQAACLAGAVYSGGSVSSFSNLDVIDCDVFGTNKVGGIAGEIHGNISSVSFTGDVSGNDRVGGIAGEIHGNISSVSYTGDVSGNDRVGGIAGEIYGDISSVSFTGDVSGNNYTGGLTGINQGVIELSSSIGSIFGYDRTGGLTGQLNNGTIKQSYFIGEVNGGDFVGGLTGSALGLIEESFSQGAAFGSGCVGGIDGGNASSVLKNNYSSMNIEINADNIDWPNPHAGGILGCLSGHDLINNYFSGTIIDSGNDTASIIGGIVGGPDNWSGPFTGYSFWDIEVDPSITRSAEDGSSDPKSEGKMTSQMFLLETFSDWDWDIALIGAHENEIWYINEAKDYPRLGWEVKEFSLTYLINPSQGGAIIGTSTQIVYRADNGSSVEAVPEIGWNFIEWDDGVQENIRTDLNISSNLTMVASFEIKKYSVIFRDYNGSIISSQLINHGLSASEPTAPNREGYSFIGWDIDFSNVIENLEIVAHYSKNPSGSTYVPKPASGSGLISIFIPMNKNGDIGEVGPKGVNLLAYIGSQGGFYISTSSQSNAQHNLLINNIDLLKNKIFFTIYSEPKSFELVLGEEILIDLDKDGVKDISVMFVDIFVNRVELTITSLLSETLPLTPELDQDSTKDINYQKQQVLQLARQMFTEKNQALTDRLAGRILLQVEQIGQAWYLDPVSRQRYYLGRPDDAFNLMRKFGLGVSNQDFNYFTEVGVPSRLAGRIILLVEKNGEAFYINPIDQVLHYLGRPNDAFRVMREVSLGITNQNINQIEIGE